MLSCVIFEGTPRRELLLFAPGAQAGLLVGVDHVLVASGLDLVARSDCAATAGAARLYDQRNAGMSRKQLVPIVIDGVAKL